MSNRATGPDSRLCPGFAKYHRVVSFGTIHRATNGILTGIIRTVSHYPTQFNVSYNVLDHLHEKLYRLGQKNPSLGNAYPTTI